MRVLLVTEDCWNDGTNGNNIYTNWFEGFDAEFATIYCGPGVPDNTICTTYFQVTDKMMISSLYSKKAGHFFEWKKCNDSGKRQPVNVEADDVVLYAKLKHFACEPLRLLRDVLWSVGRYDIEGIRAFINDFNPDIIFCPHLFSIKSRRLERIVRKLSDAPMIAFTGDAEASLRNVNYNPLYWMRQMHLYRLYPKHVKLFEHYFTFSQKQCEEITSRYGVPASPLYKCADIKPFGEKKVNEPIKLIYAGRLYCNRWKTISAIGDALKELNKESVKAEVYVYSQDQLSAGQRKALSEEKYIHFMGAVHPSKLSQIYIDADIALHVESFDKKYKYATMHSFSTKIIDLMSSTCAIMAICWSQNNGLNYLKKENAAICVSAYEDILPTLKKITKNPELISGYAKKASECGMRNHSRAIIQNQIVTIFSKYINESKE